MQSPIEDYSFDDDSSYTGSEDLSLASSSVHIEMQRLRTDLQELKLHCHYLDVKVRALGTLHGCDKLDHHIRPECSVTQSFIIENIIDDCIRPKITETEREQLRFKLINLAKS
jgi:hypothetical protein